jgi:epoxyqueuosine reductase
VLTSDAIKRRAHELGFDLCGVAPAESFPELDFLERWIALGYAGTMGYMPRTARRRSDVRQVIPGARSVVMTGTIYQTQQPYSIEEKDKGRAQIARYARAEDYHDVIGQRLDQLLSWITSESSEALEARAYVDTGPVQERVYAQYAGLGWIGKNTCVINETSGSWILLGGIITTLHLETDAPAHNQCGTCTLCIEACPTAAIVEPYVLDARRCISYLTIEQRGDIPDQFREAVGNHVFGCDICQEVCPWNHAPALASPAWPAREGLGTLTLMDLFRQSDDELAAMIAGTPLTRAGAKGLKKNLAVALRNIGYTEGMESESRK